VVASLVAWGYGTMHLNLAKKTFKTWREASREQEDDATTEAQRSRGHMVNDMSALAKESTLMILEFSKYYGTQRLDWLQAVERAHEARGRQNNQTVKRCA
jgi:hypothetical protein